MGIIGSNGSGKTILAKALAKKFPIFGANNSENYSAIFVSFQSEFHLKHGASTYRQQRWNWTDPELIPTVKQELDKLANQNVLQNLILRFNFQNHLNRFVISLSNGEQRKFELIKALSETPDLLVIDNAFNGLDKASRELLAEMLNQLVEQQHSVVITGLKKEDFPDGFSKFIYIDKNKKCHCILRDEIPKMYSAEQLETATIPHWTDSSHKELICLNNLGLKIGDKQILQHINWQVHPGERWVLSGGNGSGKTSLLNMIFADNPRAYKYDIRLFGQQRGSGESIWEIKDKIGFVSPEMHQYLPGKQSVNDVVSSGFFGSEGIYQHPSSFQRNLANQWLQLIGLKNLTNEQFDNLPASAQRMVLILRALIKNPPLILLDEPFQGLDPVNIEKLKQLLNLLATNTNVAMIFVSHFEDEIPTSFNLEMRLNDGKIELKGPRNE